MTHRRLCRQCVDPERDGVGKPFRCEARRRVRDDDDAVVPLACVEKGGPRAVREVAPRQHDRIDAEPA
jgi:hypothetical protein